MKYFYNYMPGYILGFLILFSQQSQAQYAYANAGFNMHGTGYNMGQQACPYMPSGRGGMNADMLEDRAAQIEADIEDLQADLDDLETLDHDRFDSSKVPFRSGIASYLGEVIRNSQNLENQQNCPLREPVQAGDASEHVVVLYNICVPSKGQVPSSLCTLNKTLQMNYLYDYKQGESYTFEKGSEPEKETRATKNCEGWVKEYTKILGKIKKKEKELKKAEEQAERARDKQEKAEERAADRGYTLPEGAYCAGCVAGYPEPEISGRDKAIAIGTDLISAFAWYKGTRYVSQNNARLGWATPPLALGMPYPYATANLYGAAYGGGAGSMGCSPTIGGFPGAYGPGGIGGSQFGQFSPYGNQAGGAYGFPGGGYPGFNPSFGGGMYNPGVGQWGMPGPWGGSGAFPPTFGVNAMLGAGAGAGYGGGGFPFPGAGGYGGNLGYGGGNFAGAYPGPYNFGYGLNGNGITGYPGGGNGGFPPNFGGYPGGGYAGAGVGGWPYGGSGFGGGGFPGYGAGAGFGGYAGAGAYNPYNPYGSGGFGAGFGAGYGNPYGYDPRVMQQQQVIGNQLIALDIERDNYFTSYMYRRQQLMYYLSTGSFTGGVSNGPGGLTPPPIGGTQIGTPGLPPR